MFNENYRKEIDRLEGDLMIANEERKTELGSLASANALLDGIHRLMTIYYRGEKNG